MGLVADPGSGGTVMRQLPKRPNLDQLRRQARELQRRSSPQRLSAAQLALAREYGFRSWLASRPKCRPVRLHLHPRTFAAGRPCAIAARESWKSGAVRMSKRGNDG